MDYLYVLLAICVVALPLAGAWVLIQWRARRDHHANGRRRTRSL